MIPHEPHTNGTEPRGRPEKHGVPRLKQAVRTLGSRTVDKRTAMGRALAAWRSELLADLGGIESVSTQELALVEEAVKTKLILDSVDAWLLSQPSLVNKRRKTLPPVIAPSTLPAPSRLRPR